MQNIFKNTRIEPEEKKKEKIGNSGKEKIGKKRENRSTFQKIGK